MSGSTERAAGWFPDPNGDGERYWDGSTWTDHRSVSGEPKPLTLSSAKRVDMDKPVTPRFWLRVGAAAAVGVVLFFVFVFKDAHDRNEKARIHERETQQHQEEFGRNLRDACLQNPGQCGG
jgi:hypothetical protein